MHHAVWSTFYNNRHDDIALAKECRCVNFIPLPKSIASEIITDRWTRPVNYYGIPSAISAIRPLYCFLWRRYSGTQSACTNKHKLAFKEATGKCHRGHASHSKTRTYMDTFQRQLQSIGVTRKKPSVLSRARYSLSSRAVQILQPPFRHISCARRARIGKDALEENASANIVHDENASGSNIPGENGIGVNARGKTSHGKMPSQEMSAEKQLSSKCQQEKCRKKREYHWTKWPQKKCFRENVTLRLHFGKLFNGFGGWPTKRCLKLDS